MNINEMIQQLQAVDQAAKGLRDSPVKGNLRIHLGAAIEQLGNQERWEAENPPQEKVTSGQ